MKQYPQADELIRPVLRVAMPRVPRLHAPGGNEMIQELETVVLTHDVPEHGLKRGDVGAVIHRYADRGAFEADIGPMGSGEILHARKLASA